MKRGDATVEQYEQPIKMEKPLQIMFVLQLYCIICQRNHAAIFKAQFMAEKTTTNLKISIS